MITLAIDTSTSRGSVALHADGEFVFTETFTADRSHSASLFGALERARVITARVDCVAVGLGPGSYAGVRIAIAAAIGFELALGARLVGVPSVAALETAAPEYLAIGDARRATFYYTHVRARDCVDGPRLVSEDELHKLLHALPALPVYSTAPLDAFPRAQIALPSAEVLAQMADAGTSIFATENLEPIYLREPFITPPKAR